MVNPHRDGILQSEIIGSQRIKKKEKFLECAKNVSSDFLASEMGLWDMS